jgi:hypothetical protein
MHDEKEKDTLTRRGFLGVSSGALAAAGILSPANVTGQEKPDYKSKSDRSASDPGPTVVTLEAANRIPLLPLLRMPAACKPSSTLSRSGTSGFMKAGGPAK